MTAKRVFISYARADTIFAQQIASALGAAGQDVSMDVTSVRGGEDFSQKLDGLIRACDCLLVIWSQASVASAWVRAEVERARSIGKAIVPVRVDGSDIPLPFSVLHTLSLEPGHAPDLAKVVAAIVGGPSAAAVAFAERPPVRLKVVRVAAAAVALAGLLAVIGVRLLTSSRAKHLSQEAKRAIALMLSEDECTTIGDEIFQCVYPNADMCHFNATFAQTCKSRPPTVYCRGPAVGFEEIRTTHAARCYLTLAACAATGAVCDGIDIPLRHRTDVPTGSPTAAVLRASSGPIEKRWAVVFGDRRRLVTSFDTEEACRGYIGVMPGGAHRCIERPPALYCRYGGMMLSRGRQVECFPSPSECSDPSPGDTSCVELLVQRDESKPPPATSLPAAASGRAARIAAWLHRGAAGLFDHTEIAYGPLAATPEGAGYRLVVGGLSFQVECTLTFNDDGDPSTLERCQIRSSNGGEGGRPASAIVRPTRIRITCEAWQRYDVCLAKWTHIWSGAGSGSGAVKFRLARD